MCYFADKNPVTGTEVTIISNEDWALKTYNYRTVFTQRILYKSAFEKSDLGNVLKIIYKMWRGSVLDYIFIFVQSLKGTNGMGKTLGK